MAFVFDVDAIPLRCRSRCPFALANEFGRCFLAIRAVSFGMFPSHPASSAAMSDSSVGLPRVADINATYDACDECLIACAAMSGTLLPVSISDPTVHSLSFLFFVVRNTTTPDFDTSRDSSMSLISCPSRHMSLRPIRDRLRSLDWKIVAGMGAIP